MDIVVIVAIAILGLLFIASFVALIVACRHRCRVLDINIKESIHRKNSGRQNVSLVNDAEMPHEDFEVELRDVCANNSLEQILEDEEWVDDATGLMPHCIAILKTCHELTEKLVAMTMGNTHHPKMSESLSDIIEVAKRINPRVDDVVKCMYPPIDPRLLEARSAALLLSLQHLVLVTKQACQMSSFVEWIDGSIKQMESHLQVLRDAAITWEATTAVPETNQPQPPALGAVGPAPAISLSSSHV
ncbi:transmembrane protein 98-like [Lytechinus variegatus]|uniref:transmembrane protein 98-like n=1 Tax=Lytechinus variegatus TaxID=7654 RepID=UPI001BB2AA9B|nr:transmembrane protein 98-like [Lytechinus variegatus]